MFIVQAVVPATLVFIVFITAHLFVENEGSGIYLPDTNWDFDTEEVFPVPVEEIDPSLDFDKDIANDIDIEIDESEKLAARKRGENTFRELSGDDRRTRNRASKYEITRMLGDREQQLLSGAPFNIKNLPQNVIEKKDIAILEIIAKKTPLIIIRKNMATRTVEYWKLAELDIEHLEEHLKSLMKYDVDSDVSLT